MKEKIEVTITVDLEGKVLPRSFIWRGKVFQILETGRRWQVDDGEHILVMVGPLKNTYELIMQNDGHWYIAPGHDLPTIRMI